MQQIVHYVGFEVFTAVTMKKAVFLDVAPCREWVKRVSEERISSIFRVEEKRRKSASEEPAWAGANKLLVDGGDTFLRIVG
jgi:hypothetical protein